LNYWIVHLFALFVSFHLERFGYWSYAYVNVRYPNSYCAFSLAHKIVRRHLSEYAIILFTIFLRNSDKDVLVGHTPS